MGKDNDGTANIVHSEVRGGVQSNTNSAVNGYLSFLTTNNGTSGDRRAIWNQGCNVDRFSRVTKPYIDSNPTFQIFDPTQQNDDDEDAALILTLAE